jgi:acetoin utilization protein AcuC
VSGVVGGETDLGEDDSEEHRVRRSHARIAAPRPASDDVLQLVHDPALCRRVRGSGHRSVQVHDAFGLGGEDNPIFDGMHEASALVTGGTMDPLAVRVAGSMPHSIQIDLAPIIVLCG